MLRHVIATVVTERRHSKDAPLPVNIIVRTHQPDPPPSTASLSIADAPGHPTHTLLPRTTEHCRGTPLPFPHLTARPTRCSGNSPSHHATCIAPTKAVSNPLNPSGQASPRRRERRSSHRLPRRTRPSARALRPRSAPSRRACHRYLSQTTQYQDKNKPRAQVTLATHAAPREVSSGSATFAARPN